MLIRLSANIVSLVGKEPVECGLDILPLSLHGRTVERTDIVEVDVDRQTIEAEMKDIERRAALEHEPLIQNSIASDFLKNVEEAHHLFEGACLIASLTGNAL